MSIDQLGSGQGLIYQVNSSGAIIGEGVANNPLHAERIRRFALTSAPPLGGRRAYSRLQLDAVAGASNVTAVTVGGVNQMSGPVAATIGDPVQTMADVAANINAHNAVAPDYAAISYDNGSGNGVLVILAPSGVSQSALNGASVSITHSAPGNVTDSPNNDVTIHDGSDAGDNYDNREYLSGTRTFIDLDTGASPSVLDLTSATEITNDLNMRGINNAYDVQSVAISSSTVTFTRMTTHTLLIVSGNANVDVINGVGQEEGDSITLVGFASGNGINELQDRSVSVTTGDNILTSNQDSFSSGSASEAITLDYINDNAAGFVYAERCRTSPITPTTVRSGGLATPQRTGIHEISVPAGGGSFALTPGNTGASPNGLNYLRLTGSAVLAANYSVTVDVTDAKAGDSGWIRSRACTITVAPGARLIVGGYDINDELALAGGWQVNWSYDGTNLNYNYSVDPQVSNWVNTAMIGPLQVTGAEIAAATITAGKYGAGSIVTADLDPANIDLGTIGLAASIDSSLLDATLTASLGTGLKVASVTIAAANVMTGNTIPVTVLAAQAGITYKLVAASLFLDWNSVVYAGNIQANLRTNGASSAQMICVDVLGNVADAHWLFQPNAATLANPIQLVENADLLFEVDTANPVAPNGDSPITINMLYVEL